MELSTPCGEERVYHPTEPKAMHQKCVISSSSSHVLSLQCLKGPRFGNYLELKLKPVNVSMIGLDNLCNNLQDMLFKFSCHCRGIFDYWNIRGWPLHPSIGKLIKHVK